MFFGARLDLPRCSLYVLTMEQEKLFPDLPNPLSDEEIATVLHSAIARGIRRHREADLYLSGICARHLAGFVVVKPSAPRLRE
jgi:hypothetical protein